MLRVAQLGIAFSDLEMISAGDIYDMLIEQGNDEYDYPYKATQDDFDRFRRS